MRPKLPLSALAQDLHCSTQGVRLAEIGGNSVCLMIYSTAQPLWSGLGVEAAGGTVHHATNRQETHYTPCHKHKAYGIWPLTAAAGVEKNAEGNRA